MSMRNEEILAIGIFRLLIVLVICSFAHDAFKIYINSNICESKLSIQNTK